MSLPARSRHGLAVVSLVVASLLWGTSFISVKICGERLQAGAAGGTSLAFGPMLLTAIRFTVAVPLLLVFWKETRCWPLIVAGRGVLLRVSLVMAAGFIIQAAGLGYTTATISAFIGSMSVCLTPFLEWFFHVRRPPRRLVLAVILAVGAVAFMVLGKAPAAGSSRGLGVGEVLTLICAVAYAFQILWTGKATERIGAARLTVGTFAFTALASWACVLVAWPAQVPGAILAAATECRFWASFAVVVLCASIGAMVLVNVFQRYVRPTAAAVIYTTEPVFAGFFAWVVRPRQEVFGILGLVGAGLMIVADLLAAVREKGACQQDGSGGD